MAADSMLVRFQGDQGKRRLIELLQAQVIVGGDPAIAAAIADAATLLEVLPGDILIRRKAQITTVTSYCQALLGFSLTAERSPCAALGNT